MTTRAAAGVAALLVIVGALLGVAASRLGPPPATPPAARATAAPTAAPTADPLLLVFSQPLSAGCATEAAVWIVSDGGGIARFANDTWALADPTLRTLVSAACSPSELIAVGPSGRVLVADDRSRTIRVDDTGIEDLSGVSLLADGSALVAGTGGTVLLRSTGWGRFAQGIAEDLTGVAFAGTASAWLVGAEGAAYRLEAPAGWRALPTGLPLTLRAVVSQSPDDAVVVGDGGVMLRWRGAWTAVATGVTTPLRAVARSGAVAFAAGDAGIALRVDLDAGQVERLALGTSCPIRGVFVRGTEAWFVASQGGRAAVWRRAGDGLRRWGDC